MNLPTTPSPNPWQLAAGTVLLLLGAALYLAAAAPIDRGIDWLLGAHSEFAAWHFREPALAICLFCLVFGFMSALAIPGCAVLAVAAGAIFGPWWGTLWITLASAAGATLPFLAARHWWREPIQRRLGNWFGPIDEGVRADGALYLFSLRVAPVVPFPVLNPLMGLTSIRTWTFFWVSGVGMAAGSALYALAGAGLVQWVAPTAVLSGSIVAALVGVALLPWAVRWSVRAARGRGPG